MQLIQILIVKAWRKYNLSIKEKPFYVYPFLQVL